MSVLVGHLTARHVPGLGIKRRMVQGFVSRRDSKQMRRRQLSHREQKLCACPACIEFSTDLVYACVEHLGLRIRNIQSGLLTGSAQFLAGLEHLPRN